MDALNWGQMMQESSDAFAPLDPNTYTVRVKKADAKKSSTDKLMFVVTYEVIEGPRTGATTMNNITVSPDNPKAMFFFFQNMAAMGIGAEVFNTQPPPTPEIIAQMLVGNTCSIKTSQRPYQGVMRDNVDEIKPATSGSGAMVPSLPGQVPVPQTAAPAPIPAAAPPVAPAPVAAPAPVPAAAPPAPALAAVPVPVAPAPAAAAPESTVTIPAPQNAVVAEPAPVAATPPAAVAPPRPF